MGDFTEATGSGSAAPLLGQLAEKFGGVVSAKLVYADSVGYSVTVIPAANVRYGAGVGKPDQEAPTGGVTAAPVGYIE